MKKLLAFLLAFVMLFSLFACEEKPPATNDGGDKPDGGEASSVPEANPASDFEYSAMETREGIAITKYVGTSKNVVIPETIEGTPVTVIAVSSFLCTDVESVTISDNVLIVAPRAFLGCEKLKMVDFGEGVTQILESAFEECTALEKAILPPKLEVIGAKAFYKCTALQEIFIPKTLKTWMPSSSYGIFSECTALQKLIIEDGLEVLGGQYGTFSQATSLKTLEIPASVKKIENFAFHENTSLKSVTFLGDAPQVKENVFGVTGEGSQTVSPNLIIYYDPNTRGWDNTPLSQYRLISINEK